MPVEEPRRRGCKGHNLELDSFSLLTLLRLKFALRNNKRFFVNLRKRKRSSIVVARLKPESSYLMEFVWVPESDLHSLIARRPRMR